MQIKNAILTATCMKHLKFKFYSLTFSSQFTNAILFGPLQQNTVTSLQSFRKHNYLNHNDMQNVLKKENA